MIDELEKMCRTSDGKCKELNALMKEVKKLHFEMAHSKPSNTNPTAGTPPFENPMLDAEVLLSLSSSMSAPSLLVSAVAGPSLQSGPLLSAVSCPQLVADVEKKCRAPPLDPRRKRKKPA